MGWARAVVAVVLIAPLTLSACTTGRAPTPPREESAPVGDRTLAENLAATATGSAAFVHLQALQDIAARNGGTRATGTPGYDQSVDYVADTLRRAGFDVQTPTVALGGDGDDEDQGGDAATSGTTRNVVAQTRSGRTDEVVLSGVHLDSVPEGPGIDDDGSGVAAQLEIAARLGADAPVTNAVRFVFFGAEEEGLVGSQAYVRGLSEDAQRDIALMLNSDVIAAPNGGYFVYDGDGSDGANTDAAAPGSTAIERVLTDRLVSRGVPARGTPFVDDSDYGPFVAARIATGGVFSGDAGTKTDEQARLWGGRAGAPFDPCYHRACDDIGNIDRPLFDRMVDTVAYGIGAFAVDLNGVPPRSERAAQ
ncbi:aminopeptidase S [Actinomycetospora succinea]|uniref:Aminopeptidase S n=1 Tax=Actinomycetospora succinea TaxID=663603 RepID=A0A4R6VAI1_9PSEU|nr:M20/M25/M40 family metallo-hydrolase [Actinomycetospora succinea]TDQ58886.1 aminopeptidase S [Actinomycetospora succinea]